jgi:hypothetical protein
MLHSVVALALNVLDDPVLKASETKQRYIEEAKKYIDKECSQPNLSTVHALSTLGTYHSLNGDQTLGFMYFGMSARVSQACTSLVPLLHTFHIANSPSLIVGLDVDCSEWIKSGLIEESVVVDRSWTFWATFAQDVNWSLYIGRDFCVRGPTESDFKDTAVPFVDSDESWSRQSTWIGPFANEGLKGFTSTKESLTLTHLNHRNTVSFGYFHGRDQSSCQSSRLASRNAPNQSASISSACLLLSSSFPSWS